MSASLICFTGIGYVFTGMTLIFLSIKAIQAGCALLPPEPGPRKPVKKKAGKTPPPRKGAA